MPGSVANCFKNSSNDFRSSNDRIEKLKAKTIYQSVHNNANKNTPTNPVFLNNGGFLGAVGGYNTNNYDLLLNVAKGRAYSEAQCITTSAHTHTHINTSNDTCATAISKCAIPNSTYHLLEGPFLLKTNSDNSGCESTIIKEYTNYNPAYKRQTIYSFSKLVNRDKLQNLNLHTKLPITCNAHILNKHVLPEPEPLQRYDYISTNYYKNESGYNSALSTIKSQYWFGDETKAFTCRRRLY